jgi:two-component system NtrC family response regulator
MNATLPDAAVALTCGPDTGFLDGTPVAAMVLDEVNGKESRKSSAHYPYQSRHGWCILTQSVKLWIALTQRTGPQNPRCAAQARMARMVRRQNAIDTPPREEADVSGSHARRLLSVLLVEPDAVRSEQLNRTLKPVCALVEVARTPEHAEALSRRCYFDLFVVSLVQPGYRILEWLQQLRDRGENTGIVLTSEYADVETAISALRAGASDLLVRPFRDEQLLEAIRRYLRRRQQLHGNRLARTGRPREPAAGGLVGESPVMRELLDVVERVAPTSSTLLLQGETGTGKELIARAIHQRSGRKGRFVAVNCGAIPSELLDSELFGHVRGAFTGAHVARSGLFACADNGTIFLDEVGELPLPMQANLLRVLEERRVRPVGGNQERAVSCRVIAASNVALETRVREGGFREDLYFRLNVLPIRVPALRERLDDITLLVTHFMHLLGSELGVSPVPPGADELERLQAYHWPGNVRELRNLVERALLLGKPLLTCCDWDTDDGSPRRERSLQDRFPLDLSLSEVSKQHVLGVLQSVGGNKSEAARRLHISRKTLERKILVWNDGS